MHLQYMNHAIGVTRDLNHEITFKSSITKKEGVSK